MSPNDCFLGRFGSSDVDDESGDEPLLGALRLGAESAQDSDIDMPS